MYYLNGKAPGQETAVPVFVIKYSNLLERPRVTRLRYRQVTLTFIIDVGHSKSIKGNGN